MEQYNSKISYDFDLPLGQYEVNYKRIISKKGRLKLKVELK